MVDGSQRRVPGCVDNTRHGDNRGPTLDGQRLSVSSVRGREQPVAKEELYVMSEGTNGISLTNSSGETLEAAQEIVDMVTKSSPHKPSPPNPPPSAPTPGELLAMVAKLQKQIDEAQQENAALRSQAERGYRLAVSEKGAVSVYGMGRFPITHYQQQWLRLFEMQDEIKAFIEENKDKPGPHDGKLLAFKEPRPGRPVGS